MARLLAFLMISLAGCSTSDSTQLAGVGAGDVQGWRFVSGKRPTRAEYAAVVAACQDGAVKASRGRPLETCLADLGLRKER